MWWTPDGERILQGAEWELFSEGLSVLWDRVENSFDFPELAETGITAFDTLQLNQKLWLLAAVGRALSDAGTSYPDLTANNEATVAAVFRLIAEEVECEVEEAADPEWIKHLDTPDDATSWRRLIFAAYQEAVESDETSTGISTPEELSDDEDPDGIWEAPAVDSKNTDDWEFLVDDLANRILWEDRDYEAGHHFMDVDPLEADLKKELLGIQDEYYTDVVPDPTDAEIEEIRQTLRTLCGSRAPE